MFSMHTRVYYTCASLKPSRPEASLCGLAKVTDLTKWWTGSHREDKLHCTRTLRNLREHEGHSLIHDLPLSAEGLICFKTQKARTFCEVQYLCSDPTGNAKGKCTCTHSTSSDLWSTFSFCGKCSVITLLWSYQTWNVQKKWDWVDGIFKKRNIKSALLTLCLRFENKLWL